MLVAGKLQDPQKRGIMIDRYVREHLVERVSMLQIKWEITEQ